MNGWTQSEGRGGRVLVVDDEELIVKGLARMLRSDGHEVMTATDGAKALPWVSRAEGLDAVVCDIAMPHLSGTDLLRRIHDVDADVPVILVTGNPDVDSAIQAVEHRAFRYLNKPIDSNELRTLVRRAVAERRQARVRRATLETIAQDTQQTVERAGLEASFQHALSSVWLAYQPIVDLRKDRVFGYEALLRCNSAAFPHPGVLLDAAEQLGRLDDIGRKVRDASVEPMASTDAALFVNLHPQDLADDALFDESSPLTRLASRVVLEITERATLEKVPDLDGRLSRLRRLGFRLAVDDLGAGYAGLSSFAAIEPEIVKLDMSLVRDVDRCDVKRRVVERTTALAHELKILVVAEGVETEGERRQLEALGCDLMQGYLFAKPGRAFPPVRWGLHP